MIEIQGMFGTFESQYAQIHQGDIISNAKAEDANYKMDRPHVFDKIGPTIFPTLSWNYHMYFPTESLQYSVHILPLISYGLLRTSNKLDWKFQLIYPTG